MRSLWHLAVLATCLQAVAPACAQIVLPGAVNQAPLGSTVAPPAGSDAPRRAEAPVVRAAGEEAVIGRQFQQNGNAGVMAFSRSKTLEVDKLVLIGEQISRPSEACRVEIAGARISLKAAGMHDGLLSYDLGLEACPFSIDILDGAVLARGGTCEMTAADCRIDPSGLWGPPGGGIGAEESKSIEQLRARADKETREIFRALLAAAGKDRDRQRQIAGSQAGFSSRREEICRDYAGEDRHGFCASRVTLARAASLSAELRGSKPAARPVARKPARAAQRPAPVQTPPLQ